MAQDDHIVTMHFESALSHLPALVARIMRENGVKWQHCIVFATNPAVRTALRDASVRVWAVQDPRRRATLGLPLEGLWVWTCADTAVHRETWALACEWRRRDPALRQRTLARAFVAINCRPTDP